MHMLVMGVMSGSAPPGGHVRLRLIDRTPDGDREVTYTVQVDEARQYLRARGYMR